MDPILSVQNKDFAGDGKEFTKVPRAVTKAHFFADNSLEFGKSCEHLSWHHCASTPHRSETNGIAERAVRRVKEGASAVLVQSGLDEKWWADSMECHLRPTTRSSTMKENRRTIRSMQLWYGIWPLNGFKVTYTKQKLHKNDETCTNISRSRRNSQGDIH